MTFESNTSISQIFRCGLHTAREMIRVMTQSSVRNAVRPLMQRYRTDLLSLNYRRLKTEMHTDMMHFKVKSLLQNKCAQICLTKSWARAYPIRSKLQARNTLRLLAEDVRVLSQLVYDNAWAMTGHDTEFQKTARFLRIK